MQSTTHIASINIGKIREFPLAGNIVRTAFFKDPVNRKIEAGPLGLSGDEQADPTVHGGWDKAVYAYPGEHYPSWERTLGKDRLSWGSFGENLTIQGLTEEQVYIGDTFAIGDALLQVTQPRSPCYKLQIRFDRPDAVALFVREGHPGWYFSVLKSGSISPGDLVSLTDRKQEAITIADVWALSFKRQARPVTLQQIEALEQLPAFWKERIYSFAGRSPAR
ncbi:MOSC domain-containing protein [Silvibacterium acidisoli]|uniref:MOSC domain-containing protein n=1 Tax=Acidobacteriaceae bacterium ZG23-2 TaxID=2883246 RepID=UPI00406CC534